MKTDRKTPKDASAHAPRLVAAASPTRSVTVRLPVDLFEHLQSLSQAGSGSVTNALIAVIRMHRDGNQGASEVARLAGSYQDLSAQLAGFGDVLGNLRDEVSMVRGSQGRTLNEVSKTLGLLFQVLRDGDTLDDESSSSSQGSSGQLAPSHSLGGTAELPVTRMPGTPGSRPASPSPFRTDY